MALAIVGRTAVAQGAATRATTDAFESTSKATAELTGLSTLLSEADAQAYEMKVAIRKHLISQLRCLAGFLAEVHGVAMD